MSSLHQIVCKESLNCFKISHMIIIPTLRKRKKQTTDNIKQQQKKTASFYLFFCHLGHMELSLYENL